MNTDTVTPAVRGSLFVVLWVVALAGAIPDREPPKPPIPADLVGTWVSGADGRITYRVIVVAGADGIVGGHWFHLRTGRMDYVGVIAVGSLESGEPVYVETYRDGPGLCWAGRCKWRAEGPGRLVEAAGHWSLQRVDGPD